MFVLTGVVAGVVIGADRIMCVCPQHLPYNEQFPSHPMISVSLITVNSYTKSGHSTITLLHRTKSIIVRAYDKWYKRLPSAQILSERIWKWVDCVWRIDNLRVQLCADVSWAVGPNEPYGGKQLRMTPTSKWKRRRSAHTAHAPIPSYRRQLAFDDDADCVAHWTATGGSRFDDYAMTWTHTWLQTRNEQAICIDTFPMCAPSKRRIRMRRSLCKCSCRRYAVVLRAHTERTMRSHWLWSDYWPAAITCDVIHLVPVDVSLCDKINIIFVGPANDSGRVVGASSLYRNNAHCFDCTKWTTSPP